jgi:hypothetical protein
MPNNVRPKGNRLLKFGLDMNSAPYGSRLVGFR